MVAVVQGAPEDRAEAMAARLMSSRVKRLPGDNPPPAALTRLLLRPVAVRRLDRVREARLPGGLLLDARFHAEDYRFRLADSLLVHAGMNPDRYSFWALLGIAVRATANLTTSQVVEF